MQNFKFITRKFSSTFLLGFMTLGMTACTLPKSASNSDKAATSATFNISSLQAEFTTTKTDPTFAIPVSKTLSFKACVSDLQYGKTIQGHKFLVSSNAEDVEVTTDNSGCAIWEESINYNHIADAKYLQIDRTMTAKGFQKGSRTLSIAINPWEGKALSLKDSKVQNLISADQAQTYLKGEGNSKSLWLQSPVTNILQKEFSSYRTVFSVEFLAEPKFITRDSANQPVINNITAGQFDIQFYFFRAKLGTKGKQREMIAKPPVFTIDSLRFGKIAKTFDVNLPGGCSLSQYQLGVKITPKDSSLKLAPFQGVYELGECEKIQGPKSLRFMDEYQQQAEKGLFTIEKYASESLPSSEKLEGTTDSAIKILPITPVYPITYIPVNNSVYEKIKHFGLKICAVTANNQPIPYHEFKITGINGEVRKYITESNGCIANALDSFPFNYFAKECWLKNTVTVESDSLGFRKVIPVIVNTVYEFGNFVTDLSENPTNPIAGTCADGDSKFTSEVYSYDKLSFDYEIDPYLGIKIHKKVLFRMNVRAHRPVFNTAEGAIGINLPVGDYKFRWAVVDNSVTNYKDASGKIYGAGERDVKVNANSSIQIEELDLALINLKAIGSTNQLLVELSPVGSSKNSVGSTLKSFPFRGPILLQNNSEGNNVYPLEDQGPIVESLTIQLKLDQEKIIQEAKDIATKEYFAKETTLDLLNLNDVSLDTRNKFLKVGIQKIDFQNWINTGVITIPIAKQLCNHWINDILSPLTKKPVNISWIDGALSECQKAVEQNPHRFFDIEYRYFIDNPKMVGKMPKSTRDLSINRSFSLSTSYSFNNSKSLSADIGGSLSAKSLDSPFSASLGVKYGMSTSWTYSDSRSNSIGVSSGISATVETIGIQIQPESYEKCVSFKLNPNQLIDKDKSSYTDKFWSRMVHNTFQLSLMQRMAISLSDIEKLKLSQKGYLVCTGVKEKKTFPDPFIENYYIINQKNTVTQGSDSNSNATRDFFIALRGRGDYTSFISMIQGSVPLPDSPFDDYFQTNLMLDPTQQVFAHKYQSYPGQIVAPR